MTLTMKRNPAPVAHHDIATALLVESITANIMADLYGISDIDPRLAFASELATTTSR